MTQQLGHLKKFIKGIPVIGRAVKILCAMFQVERLLLQQMATSGKLETAFLRIEELEVLATAASLKTSQLEELLATSYKKIVQTELALETALIRQMFVKSLTLNPRPFPGEVLFSTEDDEKTFQPQNNFLYQKPYMPKLLHHHKALQHPTENSRFLYSTDTTTMLQALRLLLDFSWEESGIPMELVNELNQSLNGMTVLSRHVQKIVLDAGITVPTAVTGAGAEHILNITPSPSPVSLGAEFRFLHVSSCTPSKGADVLLQAYFDTFTAEDPVTLVIIPLTTSCSHIEKMLSELYNKHSNGPKVCLLKDTTDDGVLRTMYQNCHCMVAPGRGEGFSLPLAEAMLHDMPVITTAYGGQTDFCTEETAWLVDYRFVYCRSQLDLFNSVWVEPACNDLAVHMRTVYELHSQGSNQLYKKTQKARQLVLDQLSWPSCIKRFKEFISAIEQTPAIELPIRMGWVSSWQTKCGIASYSSFLLKHMDTEHLQPVIFANNADPLRPDETNVHRCWNNFKDQELNDLRSQIFSEQVEMLVVQFNFGFYDLYALASMFEELLSHSVGIVLFLHSAADTVLDGSQVSLAPIVSTLTKLDRIMVHNVSDMNILKGFGLVDNVTLFPQGVHALDLKDRQLAKESYGLPNHRIIGAYGFLLPHKGIEELIEATALLRTGNPDIHLLLINALYPHPSSEETLHRCRELIERLGLSDSVTMINEYLDDTESLSLLAACDLVVYPYQQTQESSSAAVRMAVALLQPIACTPLDIFNDVKEFVHLLPGTSPKDLALGIDALLGAGEEMIAHKQHLQKRWIDQHAWPRLGERLTGILKSCCRIRRDKPRKNPDEIPPQNR